MKRSRVKVQHGIPASALAAKHMLEARTVANALLDLAIQLAARLDHVDPKQYAYDHSVGQWRHISTLQPTAPSAGKVTS